MQCDVDGQDDPFQSSWEAPARRPYPTNCSAVGKKLSLYIWEGKAPLLSPEAFRPKGKRKAGTEATPPSKLMKAVNVWRIEESLVRWVLLRRAIGCTTSEKEY
jgi:hypothetical protein